MRWIGRELSDLTDVELVDAANHWRANVASHRWRHHQLAKLKPGFVPDAVFHMHYVEFYGAFRAELLIRSNRLHGRPLDFDPRDKKCT